MTRVLVTGATGFIGHHVLARLASGDPDAEVVGLRHIRSPEQRLQANRLASCDLADPRATEEIVEEVRPDAVLHLAGTATGTAHDLYRSNLLATSNLVEALSKHSPSARVVLCGSAAEYGPVAASPISETTACSPSGPYGLSKYAATLCALEEHRRSGLPVAVARLFNVVGSGMPDTLLAGAVIGRMRSALATGHSSIAIGHLDAIRDFIAVDDAVDALLGLLSGKSWGKVVNICSGKPTAVGEVAKTLLELAPRHLELRQDDSLFRSDEAASIVGDPSRARAELGFVAKVPLEDALRSAWIESGS